MPTEKFCVELRMAGKRRTEKNPSVSLVREDPDSHTLFAIVKSVTQETHSEHSRTSGTAGMEGGLSFAKKYGTYIQKPLGNELHGFVLNMPFDQYAEVDALNASKIVNMRRSPMWYKHNADNPSPSTPATIEGSLIHRLVLEPSLETTFAIWGLEEDQKVRNGKVWQAFQQANAGKVLVTKTEYERVIATAEAALKNEPIARYSQAEGPTEVSMFWRHPVTDQPMKARIDKLITATHTIFDLKTTVNCHSWAFGGQAYKLGYHLKIAHYAQGYKVLTGISPTCKLGALDKAAPNEAVVYRVTDDVLMLAAEELQTLVYRIAECNKSGKWPGEYDDETDLILPAYAGADNFNVEEI